MSTSTLPQGISPGEVYSLDAFKKLTRLGDYAIRMAKKRGLRVRRTGGQSFVSADDFIAYLNHIEEANDAA